MGISELRNFLKEKSEAEKAFIQTFDGTWEGSYTYSEAFLYLADMAKDVRDTFRPYKRPGQVVRDVFQLFYGLKNVCAGLIHFSLATLMHAALFAGALVIAVFPLIAMQRNERNAAQKMLFYAFSELYLVGSSIIGSAFQFLRGVTQVATAPLSLLRAIGKRCFFHDVPFENFKERVDIKSFVDKAASPSLSLEERLAIAVKIYKKNKDAHICIERAIRKNIFRVCNPEFEPTPNTHFTTEGCCQLSDDAIRMGFFCHNDKRIKREYKLNSDSVSRYIETFRA